MYPFAVTSVLLAFTLSVQPALLPVDSLVYQNAMQSVYQYVLNQEGSSPVTGVYDAASLTSLDNTSRGWGQGVRLDEQNRHFRAQSMRRKPMASITPNLLLKHHR